MAADGYVLSFALDAATILRDSPAMILFCPIGDKRMDRYCFHVGYDLDTSLSTAKWTANFSPSKFASRTFFC
jgi:hypothetical protein